MISCSEGGPVHSGNWYLNWAAANWGSGPSVQPHSGPREKHLAGLWPAARPFIREGVRPSYLLLSDLISGSCLKRADAIRLRLAQEMLSYSCGGKTNLRRSPTYFCSLRVFNSKMEWYSTERGRDSLPSDCMLGEYSRGHFVQCKWIKLQVFKLKAYDISKYYSTAASAQWWTPNLT